MTHRNSSKFARRQHAALDMHMRIDEARHEIPRIHERVSSELFHRHDARAFHANLCRINTTRVKIDELMAQSQQVEQRNGNAWSTAALPRARIWIVLRATKQKRLREAGVIPEALDRSTDHVRATN